jgi:diguanylate cyclase (GGDEF)-like protein/PAS domain S-box-containing protein
MPRTVYVIGAIAAAAILFTIAYTYHIGIQMGEQHIPLLETSQDIESELATAHMRLEELLSGNRLRSLDDDVLHLIDRADWNAASLIEGGWGSEGAFEPLDDETLRADVGRVREGIKRFRALALKRWNILDTPGSGSDIEARFDAVYADVLQSSIKVRSDLEGLIGLRAWRFRQVVFVLFAMSTIIAIFGVFYIRSVFLTVARTRRTLLDSLDELRAIIDELKKSESKMGAILESVGDAIITIGEDGTIQTFNPAAQEIFGYSPEEAMGINISLLMPEPHRSSHNAYIQDYLRTGHKNIIGLGRETVAQRKDGTVFPIYLNVTEAYAINQRIFVGIIRDISRRKQIEQELENLASFPELNPNPIIEIDEGCRVTYINPATESMFPGLKEDGCAHPLLHDMDDILTTLTGEDKQLAIRTVAIGEHFYEVHFSKAHDHGKVRLYVTDITERRKTEERLRLSSKFFEETTEALVVTDLEGTIQDVNAAFEEMTGYSKEEAVGQNPRILKSGRHDREFYKRMWQSIIETGNWQGEIWDRRKNGEVYPKWMSISTVRDDDGKPTHYVGISADISRLKRTQEQLHYLAHYDQLTGLPNRLLAHERLQQAITFAKRHGHMLAVLLLDLDEFKRINDSMGHLAGDQLLNEVGRRLKDNIRESDDVARIGGDEFTVLLRNVRNPANAAHLAQKLIQSLSEPYSLYDHEVYISSSIGITLCPEDGEDMFTLMKNADAAMYHAKRSGRNNYQFFTKELNDRIMDRLVLEMRLRRAVEDSELVLYYQPRVDIVTGEILGMEALLRWTHDEYGTVPPTRFIPIAEETGLIIPLGAWVLREACVSTVAWNREFGLELKVSVNLSARQFRKQGLADEIRNILEDTGLPPHLLELEITESVIMDNIEKSIELMNRLRDMGVKLSLDDFGTGYSSLSYLNRFPINNLKIDRSFVLDLTTNPEDRAVVKAVIVLARSLGLRVIAEGVETQEQFDFLVREGCEEIQGNFFSLPVAPEAFETIIRDRVKL